MGAHIYMTLCNTIASGVVCALYIQICIVSNIAALQQAVTSSNSLLTDHKVVIGRYNSVKCCSIRYCIYL